MKKIIFGTLAALSILISCKKNDPPAPAAPKQYMSLSAGSTWHYEILNNTPPASTNPYILTSTSRDSSINSKTYHVFTNSSGSSNEYYNITGNDYYNFRSLPSALGGTSVEYLYLKDNAAAGSSWSQAYPVMVSGVALNATLTNTITEKGISKTVKGISYDNVIHVTTTITVSLGAIPLPASAITTDIQSFYAVKIGMIQSYNKINVDYGGIKENTDQQTSLVSSDIK